MNRYAISILLFFCVFTGLGQVPVPEAWNYGSMGGFHTLDEAYAEIDSMRILHPDLISVRKEIDTFMVTQHGRPLYWVKISDNPDNYDYEEARILYTSLHNARDPVGLSQMLFYMNHLLESYDSDPEVKNLLDNTELYFIPCVNPDGYEFNRYVFPNGGGIWSKNRRLNWDGSLGVNLDRNFNYEWGHDSTGSSGNAQSEFYRGTAGFSEAETKLVRNVCYLFGFNMHLNFQSYGNKLLYPWGYTDEVCEDDTAYRQIAAYLTSKNQYEYLPAYEFMPMNGCAIDWMQGEQDKKARIHAYTVMLGNIQDNYWPNITRIIPIAQENVHLNKTAAFVAGWHAVVNDKNDAIIEQTNGYFVYDFQRIGLMDSSFYTVGIVPISNNIHFVEPDTTYEYPEHLKIIRDSIAFQLDPTIAYGDEVVIAYKIQNDRYTTYDTISKVFGTKMVLFEDNFDDLGKWTGGWMLTDTAFVSPDSSLTDSPEGNYPLNDVNIIRTTEEINLNDLVYARLTFHSKWSIEVGWDYAQIEISTDGGSNWNALEGKYTIEGNENQAAGEPLYNGFQEEWVKEEIDLTDYLDTYAMFRFKVVSDSWVTEDGYYVDDFLIEGISPSVGIEDRFTYSSQISEAYPNPASQQFHWDYSIEMQKQTELLLYDVYGRIVHSILLDSSESSYSLNVEDWQPSLYFYSIYVDGNLAKTGKLIVQ